MVQIWVIIGLIISAVAVSVLGATFSIVGVGKLFSGEVLAVSLMAGSLEFAKFIVAAYLHQTWAETKLIFKTYLVGSVAILSIITSMGIFGFLTDAYSSASSTLETETITLSKLESEKTHAETEVKRLSNAIEEIPDTRISRKIKARTEAEPEIKALQDFIIKTEREIASTKIKLVEVKQKVGPLIYISKAFSIDIDTVVKYMILIYVIVFDPLAICLVIALSDAMEKRSRKKAELKNQSTLQANSSPVPNETDKVMPAMPEESNIKKSDSDSVDFENSDIEVIPTLKMKFADEVATDISKPSKTKDVG